MCSLLLILPLALYAVYTLHGPAVALLCAGLCAIPLFAKAVLKRKE